MVLNWRMTLKPAWIFLFWIITRRSSTDIHCGKKMEMFRIYTCTYLLIFFYCFFSSVIIQVKLNSARKLIGKTSGCIPSDVIILIKSTGLGMNTGRFIVNVLYTTGLIRRGRKCPRKNETTTPEIGLASAPSRNDAIRGMMIDCNFDILWLLWRWDNPSPGFTYPYNVLRKFHAFSVFAKLKPLLIDKYFNIHTSKLFHRPNVIPWSAHIEIFQFTFRHFTPCSKTSIIHHLTTQTRSCTSPDIGTRKNYCETSHLTLCALFAEFIVSLASIFLHPFPMKFSKLELTVLRL